MIVTIGNTKGAVGKTTLAVQLALGRRLAGRDVLLIDADRERSAQNAAMLRAESGRYPALACVQLATAGCYGRNSAHSRPSMTTP